MKKEILRIEFRNQGADTLLDVSAPNPVACVAALTESLRLTNLRAKLQFTVRKPEMWLAHIRLSEQDGSALSPSRASELLRVYDLCFNHELHEDCKAA